LRESNFALARSRQKITEWTREIVGVGARRVLCVVFDI
jgi:hypothetical protein